MAYLQDKFGTTGVTNTIAITMTGVTAGSTLVFFVEIQDIPATATITVSDNVNGALTQTSDGYGRSLGRTWAVFTIANVSAGSHTVTGTLGSSSSLNKSAFLVECSAPTSSVIDGTPTHSVSAPGSTAADAIVSSAVTTAVNNSTVLCFCVDFSAGTFTPGTGYSNSNTGISTGTNTDSVNVEHKTQVTAGSAASTWTDATNGGGDTYFLSEIAIKAPASVDQPFDPDLPFWDEAVSTLHVDSYQNTNLDPQIDDPWPHWHEDAEDDLWLYAHDSAANPGFVDIPPPDGWPWEDDTEDPWELNHGNDQALNCVVNLLQWSQAEATSPWTTLNGPVTVTDNAAVAPDGTTTASSVVSTNNISSIIQDHNDYPPLKTATASAYVQGVTATAIELILFWRAGTGSPTNIILKMNPLTGAFITTGGTGALDNYSITALANGWFRISVSGAGTDPGNSGLRVQIIDVTSPTGATYNVWGVQVQAGLTATAYIPTTSVIDFPCPPSVFVIEDAWDWGDLDTPDEWESWQFDSAGNAGQVFQQPAEWWQQSDDDAADEWESWQHDSAANPGFVDVPASDAWPWDHVDDIDDEWWVEDRPQDAPTATADQPPDDAFWDDQGCDEWETWQDDSQANSGFVDVPPADGWPWDDDVDDEFGADHYTLEDFELEADQPAEDPFVEDDAGDDWWADDYQLIDNNPALSLEDAWAYVDLDAADPWEEWQFDSQVGADNNPVIAPQTDEWDWWEGVDDEPLVDDRTPEVAVAAQPPEDAWDWTEGDLDDEWATDQALPADFVQIPASQDEWPWEDDLDDQWEIESAPVVPDVAPAPPAALLPTDVKVQRPSRRNVRFKWGFESAIEAETPPRTAQESVKKPVQVPALLRSLYQRAGIGEKAGIEGKKEPFVEKVRPAVDAVADLPRAELGHVPRETAAQQRRARRLAVVEPRRARLGEIEQGMAAARQRERDRLQAIRARRLAAVQQGRLAQAGEIERRIAATGQRFAALQRKLDTARRQRERVDALHKQLTRAAEEGHAHQLVDRIQAIRQAHQDFEGIFADLVKLDAAVERDMGLLLGVPALRSAHLDEMHRMRRAMRRHRNNLVAVQTAVQLLLGMPAPDLDHGDGE